MMTLIVTAAAGDAADSGYRCVDAGTGGGGAGLVRCGGSGGAAVVFKLPPFVSVLPPPSTLKLPVEMELADEPATDRFTFDTFARSSSASVSEDTLLTEPKVVGSVAGELVPPVLSCDDGARLSEGGRCVRFVLLTLRTGGGGGGFIVGGFGGGADGRPAEEIVVVI
uniref:Uncharacterized protein n=1 Tax=Anopheles merus TaxID=30066 RepID=A0A182UVF2_ANOME